MLHERKNYPLIDTHHHIVSPPVIKKMNEMNIPISNIKWSPESAIEKMDNAGISFTVLSYPSAPAFLDQPQASAVVRETNEYFAKLVSDNPTRFGALATLPMPSTEDSIKETVYALDTLKLDGVAFLSSYDGKYLSHPDYGELLSELNRRSAAVFIHPILIKEHIAGLPPGLLEGTFDTTRNVTSMAVHKIFDRFPDIKFIFPHTGGMVPYIKWRIAVTVIAAQAGSIGDFLRIEASDEAIQGEIDKLERLYYDTAVNPGPLPKLTNPSRILFGTDMPFSSDSVMQYQVDSIMNKADELGEETVRAIAYENAFRLFPRLKGIFANRF